MAYSGMTSAALPSSVNGQPLPSLADMLERAMPAVVDIATEGRQAGAGDSNTYQRLFGRVAPKDAKGTGSGIIIDAKQGYIVTNAHVIQDALKIKVTLNDGREFIAKVIGRDTEADVGVIQIKPERLVAMSLANSNTLRVGDFVVAIGNPFGLGQTATSGIISALGRSGLGIESYENFIQTDAPINPGNSGGALVNLRGELVGINTAILGGRSGGSVGIGFAIPSNMVNNIKSQLIQSGEVVRGQLGVEIQNLTSDMVAKYKLKDTEGALVARVVIGSPADDAGLKSGDVIVQANGNRVKNSVNLKNIIGNLRIGTRASIEFIRDGRALITVAEIEKVDSRNGFRP
ncbi:trypsin-like serine protease [Leucothrix sargassi]|nr:trypsin-like serine protease [Leucothrix sargassi]